MMRQLFAAVLTVGYLLTPAIVSAHQLQADGSIGAVLHVDPSDDPVAGEVSSFFFDFKDKEEKFGLLNCDCQVSILQGEKELASQPLDVNSGTTNYSFPAKGVYMIKLEGKPYDGIAFQPFLLQYDIRVAKEAALVTKTSESLLSPIHLFHFGLILAVAGYTIYRIYRASQSEK
jgi:hypothetical protein